MEKVITVYLGKMAFLTDEESFTELKDYLREPKTQLTDNPDLEEIILDIDYAISEKLSENLSSGTDIVKMPMIK